MQRADSEARLWLTKTMVRPLWAVSLDASDAALLECLIADTEHLVHEENLRAEMRRNREREPHVHTARIALDGSVDELLELGEFDDLVIPCPDLGALHSKDRTVQKHVLSARQLRMKAGSNLEQ